MHDIPIKCPCCKEDRHIPDTPLLSTEAELSRHKMTPWWVESDPEEWSVKQARLGRLQWACNSCLDSGRAIAAQPWLQNFCDYPPYFAYYDFGMHCVECQNAFNFSAQEQKHWYEELKFWVQSRPIRCLTCRRKRRAEAAAQRSKQQRHSE